MAGYISLELVRQNYDAETEQAVNEQINMELYAMYSYLSMVGHYWYIPNIYDLLPLFFFF